MLDVVVRHKQREARDIASFELVDAAGMPLPRFTAGAHIDVHIRPGLVRQYSLMNSPAESRRYLIGVLRDPASRGGSAAMHDDVHAGALLRISEPKNHFPLVAARRSLLLAGGIGITPLLSMADSLASIGAEFALHYCTRSPDRTAFADRLDASAYARRTHFHVDSGPPRQRLDLAQVLAGPAVDTHLYVCGPAGFIGYATALAEQMGWMPDQLHVEHFGAAPVDQSADVAFEVLLARSGRRLSVPPDQSVVAVLERHGVPIDVSCEQGVCGTCVTGVLAGIPAHRDSYLSAAERASNACFTPCVSRATTNSLTLDL